MQSNQEVMQTAQEPQKHDVVLSFSRIPPKTCAPGAFFALRVRATCEDMPFLTGLMTRLEDHEGKLLRPLRLIVTYPKHVDTDQVSFQAPTEPGTYTWTAVFPEQVLQGEIYREARTTFTFEVSKAHPVSLSVWNVPSAVSARDKFRVTVGAKCPAGCCLAGLTVRVLREDGQELASAKLGDTPMGVSGTMYWVDFPMKDMEEGRHTCRAELVLPQDDETHTAKDCEFTVNVREAAQFSAEVEVFSKASGKRIADADVMLHPWKARTDAQGKAVLRVPCGQYRLIVSGQDVYDTYGETVLVQSDVALKVYLADSPPPVDDAG